MNCLICNKKLLRTHKRYCSKDCQHKGFIGSGNPMFRNKKLNGICKTCGKKFEYYKSVSSGKYCSDKCSNLSIERKEKIRLANKGRVMSLEARLKMSKSGKGRKFTDEHKKRISLAQKGRSAPWATGEKSNLWRGGVTVKQKGIRRSREYRIWRRQVLKRDGNKCILCNSEKELHVDHIIPFASLLWESEILNRPEAMFDVDNGRTLCGSCHRKTDNYNQKRDKQIEARLIKALMDLWKHQKSKLSFKDFYILLTENLINEIQSKIK